MIKTLNAYQNALTHFIQRRKLDTLGRSTRKPLKTIMIKKMKFSTIWASARKVSGHEKAFYGREDIDLTEY